jgi:serine/threonine protein kinase
MTAEVRGEPPADADDEVLAAFLEEAFQRRARGEVVRPAELLAHMPHLIPAGERLLADAHDLFRAALGLRGRSRLLSSEQIDRAADLGPAPPAPVDPFPGEFRLVRLLGQGAFGSVWLADDLHLGRPVALKMIRSADSSAEAGRRLARLREEARLLAAVRHPNIVAVDAWRESRAADGPATPFLVLQLVQGGSLADRVRREGPLAWEAAARYAADVADGLLAVHAAGIVHRDVKPANVLWDATADEALLTDFGVSTRLAAPGAPGGTPYYMPPEAFAGAVGPAQDVYGLAATLFWTVTGSVPFPATARDRLLAEIAAGLPDPEPRCAALPAALEGVIRAGLAPDPAVRPGLAEFAAELRGVLNQLLADRLAPPAGGAPAPATVRLAVSRQVDRFTFLPVAVSRPEPGRLVRDLKRVPPEPERADLYTGQRVRVEVECGRPGFVTLFNLGPTGNLNVLSDVRDGMTRPDEVTPGRPLHVADVALTPPAGSERLFALWTRPPLPLRLGELLDLANRGKLPVSGAYHATRDMERIKQSVQQLGREDWCIAVLNLRHAPQEIAP